MSLSERSLFSISSQFLSLSLNNILEKNNIQEDTCSFTVALATRWHTEGYTHRRLSQYNYLIFPAVLSTEFLILVDSWETELSSRLSNTAWIHRGKEIKFDKWWPEGDCLMSVYFWCHALCAASHLLSVPGAPPQSSGLQTVRSTGAELHRLTVDLWCLIGWNHRRDLPEVEALIEHPIHQLGKDRERCRIDK